MSSLTFVKTTVNKLNPTPRHWKIRLWRLSSAMIQPVKRESRHDKDDTSDIYVILVEGRRGKK